jgi:hypothetical protein
MLFPTQDLPFRAPRAENACSGAIGDNSHNSSSVPVQVQGLTSGVTAVAAGGYQGFAADGSCAVVNGGAQCWGKNTYGTLGNDSTTDSPVPVQVQGLTSGVTAIARGQFHTCAIVNGHSGPHTHLGVTPSGHFSM